ncbi:hypothetical protein PROFUN_10817 [Planoprotostelium fungivorum]|uniref:Uncharacterized protein n=1 Tax=Planoprotostelium fungivorum TaxID=1890364 RepID=A0A2P6NCN9_9EUKA|nr:hypothetical protein PROFUN_10817 [Planoprotostelium fungivorum]
MSLLRLYQRTLESDPIKNKMLTAIILMAAGDVVAQSISQDDEEEEEGGFDWERFFRMVTVAGTWSALSMHYYFMFLDRIFVGPSATMKKWIFDQIIWAPSATSAALFYIGLLESRSPQLAVKKVEDNLWPSLKAGYMLFPLAAVINFRMVPLAYRPLFMSTVSFFWNIYFSFVYQQKLL